MQFWLIAVPGLIAIVLFVVFLAKGRPVRAAIALGVAVLAFIAWVAFPRLTGGATGGWHINLHHGSTQLVLLAVAVMIAGAVGAIAGELRSARRSELTSPQQLSARAPRPGRDRLCAGLRGGADRPLILGC